jgi:hypothetical protein
MRVWRDDPEALVFGCEQCEGEIAVAGPARASFHLCQLRESLAGLFDR